MKTACPKCSQHIEIDDADVQAFAGKVISCPQCANPMTLETALPEEIVLREDGTVFGDFPAGYVPYCYDEIADIQQYKENLREVMEQSRIIFRVVQEEGNALAIYANDFVIGHISEKYAKKIVRDGLQSEVIFFPYRIRIYRDGKIYFNYNLLHHGGYGKTGPRVEEITVKNEMTGAIKRVIPLVGIITGILLLLLVAALRIGDFALIIPVALTVVLFGVACRLRSVGSKRVRLVVIILALTVAWAIFRGVRSGKLQDFRSGKPEEAVPAEKSALSTVKHEVKVYAEKISELNRD